MKKAIVKITDRHFQDGEEACAELTTMGTLEFTEKGFIITYEETGEELVGCTTKLFVEGDERISMTRTGSFNTDLIIEKDRRHTCFYSTPYGELIMGVFGKSIIPAMTENGGSLKFRYTLDFNSTPASENELEITVAVKEEQ